MSIRSLSRVRRYGLAALALMAVCGLAMASGNGAPLLLDAVHAKRPDLVRQLVSRGADVNAIFPGDGSPLIVAARNGDLTMVDALLALGAKVNQPVQGDGNPLIAAAGTGQAAVVEHLIARGALVNLIAPNDETALIAAVRGDHTKVVEVLVTHGADVNLGVLANGTQWRTPLNQTRNTVVRSYLTSRGATRDGRH